MKSGSRLTIYVILAVAVAAVAAAPVMAKSPGGGGGGGKTSCASPVTTVIADSGGTISDPSALLPFQLQSDGKGSYVTGSGVTSQISSGCTFSLNLTGSSTRTVNITLEPVPNSGSTVIFNGTVPFAGSIGADCAINPANNNVDFGTMTGGQTLQCRSTISFSYGGHSYELRMYPIGQPASTWVQVQCTSAAGLACTQWSVGPIPNVDYQNSAGQYAAVAELLEQGTPKQGLIPLGPFYVAFGIAISK